MTPQSKAAELERRKQAKRASSNQWHAKWQSKGVPKAGEAGAEGNHEDVENTNDQAQGASNEVDGPCDHHGDAGPGDDGLRSFQPSQELLNMSVESDMRKVRAKFITQYQEANPSADNGVAQKAWMVSQLRAQILAARKRQVY